jgi:hypothetical protein
MGEVKWIAVDGEKDEVVATGSTINEVREKAKAKGIEDPMITVPIDGDQAMFY